MIYSFELRANPNKLQAIIVGSGHMRNLIDNFDVPLLLYDNVPKLLKMA